jgi:hypothetical protein
VDYNIALPQFNAPAAQVGSPVNMLTDVLKLKGLQQDQQLNQMKMQEYQRARGDAATKRAEDAKTKAELARIYGAGVNNLSPAAPANNLVAPAETPVPQMGFSAGVGEYAPAPAATPAATPAAAPAPSAPNYAGIIGELVKGGHIEEAKKMADLAKSHTETRSKEYENSVKQIDAAYAPLQALTNRVQSPADVAAYTQMLYNDPVLGPQAAKIKPLEQAIADSQREFAANPQQWQLAHSKVDGKVIYDAATTSVAPKIVAKDVGGSIKYIDENPKSPTFMKEVGDFAKTLTPKEAATGTSVNIPKAKPGEVWNPELERMDAVKGSDLYISQSQKHAKDARAVQGLARKSDEGVKTIDDILSPKNEEAFSNNFGGYGAYATRLQSGDVARVRNLLTTMASNLKASGLEEFRTGGSIGAMTEKEWPIVEKQIASLTPEMSDDDARAVITNVRNRLERIRDDAHELYKDTWENTQFYKKPKGNEVDSNNPLLK